MQWLRIVLIGGIAICAYLLLLEWADRPQQDPPAAPIIQTPQDSSAPTFPESVQPAAPRDEPDNSGLSAAPAVSEPLVLRPEATIGLESDQLKIEIALNGGGIESLSLPEYPNRIDEPDQPIELMQRTGPARYFARLGLQYQDGRPLPLEFAPNGRALSQLSLSASVPGGLEIERDYRIEPDSYQVRIEQRLHNRGTEPVSLVPYAAFYRNDKRLEESIGFGISSYLGAAWSNEEDTYIKVDFDDMRESRAGESTTGGWVAMIQHYFLAAWVPERTHKHRYQMLYQPEQDLFVMGLTSPQIHLQPGQRAEYSILLYAGPKIQAELATLAKGLDLTVDYGWLWWLGQPLFWVLVWFHKWVGNWGWAIVLLTILIKACIYPMSAAGFRSMAKLRQLQPELERLRERYGDDRQKMAEKTMAMYREKGVNPLGGCLPLLLPMPVFLALYWVLLESVELRHAPWTLWIQDLSARDPYFILPLLMGLSMVGSQLLSPPPATMDPMQRRMLQFMPVIFTVFFLWFPAGLVLYWLCNNLLSILQQWYVGRTLPRKT